MRRGSAVGYLWSSRLTDIWLTLAKYRARNEWCDADQNTEGCKKANSRSFWESVSAILKNTQQCNIFYLDRKTTIQISIWIEIYIHLWPCNSRLKQIFIVFYHLIEWFVVTPSSSLTWFLSFFNRVDWKEEINFVWFFANAIKTKYLRPNGKKNHHKVISDFDNSLCLYYCTSI